jgi:DNA-directed RNA polymerase subunit N (RpoN/RPB10)
VKIRERDLCLSSRDLEDLKGVLELVGDMKKRVVTGAAVARSCCRRMIQSIKDRVHPAYEYWGQLDPTCEINRKVSKEEMVARVSHVYSGKVKVKKCPKAHSLKRSYF